MPDSVLVTLGQNVPKSAARYSGTAVTPNYVTFLVQAWHILSCAFRQLLCGVSEQTVSVSSAPAVDWAQSGTMRV